MIPHSSLYRFFFFNDTATTEIYTLSLHDALPISRGKGCRASRQSSTYTCGPQLQIDRIPRALSRESRRTGDTGVRVCLLSLERDRKSTRLNSSHVRISYAVFCLKKKKRRTLEVLS